MLSASRISIHINHQEQAQLSARTPCLGRPRFILAPQVKGDLAKQGGEKFQPGMGEGVGGVIALRHIEGLILSAPIQH